MTELETQVAKIQIGDPKQATTYVYVLAEKVDATESELYVLCELPLFNPAARADCERISEAIGASLLRSYRKSANDNTFENALAQINEELGKLAGLGKTHWIGKLNALVAAKRGRNLSIATVGKVTALLYRDGNFTTVSEATTEPTPLKTFENFALGKLRLQDLLVFSTTQLLNHISIDRIRQILEKDDLPQAAGSMVEILRDNAGPEVACGTILALQVRPGEGDDEEIDLSQYVPVGNGAKHPVAVASAVPGGATMMSRAASLPKKILQSGQSLASGAVNLLRHRPKVGMRDIMNKNKSAAGVVNQQFKKATNQLRPETFRGFSTTKKFFFISAGILLIALIISVTVTQHYRSVREKTATTLASIADLQKLANDANAALIYGDDAKARELWLQLQDKLAQAQVDADSQSALDEVKKQAAELESRFSKVSEAAVTTLGALSNANSLITLPTYLATETKRTIVSYNRTSKSVQDNVLHTSEPIVASVLWKAPQAVIYNGKELLLWNFQTGLIGGAFSDSVPDSDHMKALVLYPTNNRVYILDTSASRVMSFAVTDKTINKPTVSLQNVGDLSQASGLAIDGSIYIVNNGTVRKFNAGAEQDFHPALPSPLSGSTKAYAQVNGKYLYLMDSGNKRVIILDKQGALMVTLTSPEMSNMKDFTVDEKAKAIYILNDSNLLQVNF